MTKSNDFIPPIVQASPGDNLFPTTRRQLIEQAADGEWVEFLVAYARPCWNELLIQCRQRGIELPDTDDLFQELLLRFLRTGQARRIGGDGPIAGNFLERYLRGREQCENQARFRQYLKQTITYVVHEFVRARWRRRPAIEWAELEPLVENSVTLSDDRAWLNACVMRAVRQLAHESSTGRTRVRRREFAVLYGSIVERRSASDLAREHGVDRSTLASILTTSRRRLVERLLETTRCDDEAELRQSLRRHPEILIDAFRRCREDEAPPGRERNSPAAT